MVRRRSLCLASNDVKPKYWDLRATGMTNSDIEAINIDSRRLFDIERLIHVAAFHHRLGWAYIQLPVGLALGQDPRPAVAYLRVQSAQELGMR